MTAILAAMLEIAGSNSPRVHRLAARLAPVIEQEAGRQVGAAIQKLRWRAEKISAADSREETGTFPVLVAAVAWHESSYRHGAVSRAGALGVMQVLPRGWATTFCRGLSLRRLRDNVRCGVRLLREGLKRCGDVAGGLTWYWRGACGKSTYAANVLGRIP